MAVQIDLDGPLSPEDRAYLLDRGRRHLVLQNDRRFGGGGESPTPAPQESGEPDQDEEWEAVVNELTADELRAELGSRNLSTSGNKDALRARLIEAGPED